MCSMCDGATREEVRLQLHHTIERLGWAIQCVEAEAGGTPWAYTIGLSVAVGHPELVVIGSELSKAAVGLDTLGRRILAGERYEARRQGIEVLGVEVDVVAVHPAHLGNGLLDAWADYYAHFGPPPSRWEALQVVVPPGLLLSRAPEGQPRLDRPESCFGISRSNRGQRRAAGRHRRG